MKRGKKLQKPLKEKKRDGRKIRAKEIKKQMVKDEEKSIEGNKGRKSKKKKNYGVNIKGRRKRN